MAQKKLNRILLIVFFFPKSVEDTLMTGGEWTTVQIDNVTGTEISASIFFVYDGDISYKRGNFSWLKMGYRQRSTDSKF